MDKENACESAEVYATSLPSKVLSTLLWFLCCTALPPNLGAASFEQKLCHRGEVPGCSDELLEWVPHAGLSQNRILCNVFDSQL